MFWVDLSRGIKDEGVGMWNVMLGHFFLIVLVVAPVFPAGYTGFLEEVCEDLTKQKLAQLKDDHADDLGLEQLCGMIQDLRSNKAAGRLCSEKLVIVGDRRLESGWMSVKMR